MLISDVCHKYVIILLLLIKRWAADVDSHLQEYLMVGTPQKMAPKCSPPKKRVSGRLTEEMRSWLSGEFGSLRWWASSTVRWRRVEHRWVETSATTISFTADLKSTEYRSQLIEAFISIFNAKWEEWRWAADIREVECDTVNKNVPFRCACSAGVELVTTIWLTSSTRLVQPAGCSSRHQPLSEGLLSFWWEGFAPIDADSISMIEYQRMPVPSTIDNRCDSTIGGSSMCCFTYSTDGDVLQAVFDVHVQENAFKVSSWIAAAAVNCVFHFLWCNELIEALDFLFESLMWAPRILSIQFVHSQLPLAAHLFPYATFISHHANAAIVAVLEITSPVFSHSLLSPHCSSHLEFCSKKQWKTVNLRN